MIDLSVLIPAYLEDENLQIILPRIKEALANNNINAEIVVITSSLVKDETPQVCKKFNVTCINREGGENYGNAVRTGIKYAQGQYVLFMDADGSHSPEFIQSLYHQRDNADIVVASRYVNNGGSDNSRVLIMMSRLLNFSYSIFFNINCKDISNSFKLYNKKVFDGINLVSDNFDIIQEILIKTLRKNRNLTILEIPYFFKERMFGNTKRNLLLFVFGYVVTMLRLKLFK